MKTKIGVRIMPREVILDTQGRAVEQTLKLDGYQGVAVRVGKYVELEFEAGEAEAKTMADRIAKAVLHNPLTEVYRLESV